MYDGLKKLPVEDLLSPLLVQFAVILVAARLGGVLARRVGQPGVVGEVVAGLILGPSLFGWLWPAGSAAIFRPDLAGVDPQLGAAVLNRVVQMFAQVGLVLLLFVIGLEFDFSHLRHSGRTAAGISVAGVGLPFVLGMGLAYAVHGVAGNLDDGSPVDPLAFALFLGVAMSITAIPVLGRIMVELNITRTKLGAIVIAAAAIDDAIGWILLATVAAVVQTGFDPAGTLAMVGWTVLFTAVLIYAVRPVVIRFYAGLLDRNGGELSPAGLVGILILLLTASIISSRIGVFAVYGAFLFGAIVSTDARLASAIRARMSDFVTALFVPIFFTYTGLRTDVGSLSGLSEWLTCSAVIFVAVFAKWVGCGLAARLGGFSRREASIVGAMMNTRGLMELVVVNQGRELGVIGPQMFTILVLMAIVTTAMTSPIVVRLAPGTELEDPIRGSELGRKPRATSPPGPLSEAERG